MLGTRYYANGEHYDGDMVDDMRDGNGKYTLELLGIHHYNDGSKYDGEWRNDQPYGRGSDYN